MAYVAETVGAQPISFMDGAGEVMAGAKEAAVLYGAQQKAETMKLELENAKMKQDQMKVGISIDYLDKINQAANPTVKKILMKQFGNQFEKMYGKPLDQDTLNAISATPEIGAVLDQLKQTYSTGVAGKHLKSMELLISQGLSGPFNDLPPLVKQLSDMTLEERKAEEGARAALARTDLATKRANIYESKSVQSALKEAEEDPEVRMAELQVTGANKGLLLMERGLKNYKDSGGENTITWGQLGEALTDMAQLQTVKAGAAVPVARERDLKVDLPMINRFISQVKTNMTANPDQGVNIGQIKLMKEQFEQVRTVLEVLHERELKKGYSRGVDSGLLDQETVDRRLQTAKNNIQTQFSETAERLGLIKPKKAVSIPAAVASGMTYEQIYSQLDPETKKLFTQKQFELIKSAVKANQERRGK